jgi:uncharacterized protein (DUF2384 family)
LNGDRKLAPRRGQMMRFRRTGPKLSADGAARQGQVTHLAFLTLGGRDAAIEFLNNPNTNLGGRPIDIAIASAEGAAMVTGAIKRLAKDAGEDQ